MQFYDVIKERKSIKNFKSTPIQKDKLDRILTATIMSPSWKDNKCFKFILVDNESQKKELSMAVMNDVNSASASITQAPLVSVVVADPSSSGSIDNKDLYLVDSGIAMEHLVLACTNEGYGTCWIASLDEDKIKRTLDIPDKYRVVAMSPIGEYSDYDDNQNNKPATDDYVCLNKWDSPYTNIH
ncbi:nitroreductase family protein [Tepidibacter hydrothermalis]|uniref:Nitroreductase family protein n=1 Tax=Tepidibacter hydrothermalis TaxID=3036126 RepID=A0ABY8EGT4_9FIRM|nr:nitroreductase family protein [Tepidibacter hydrothermalis]WFD12158.1 nitroreductase family protein [Tepidibacter hydrothermalis]